MQYTVRGISEALDRAIRHRARVEGKSLNEVAVEALTRGLGLTGNSVARRDLDDIVGTWAKDKAAEAIFGAQVRIDQSLWK